MQTFLPFESFTESAKALDNKRLNKQILEGYQILKVLSNDDPHAAWRNHPAVKMWRGHENSLLEYIIECIREADKRGIKTDKNLENIRNLRNEKGIFWGNGKPDWFAGEALERVLATHKANLYRKEPEFYFDFYEAVESPSNEPCCEKCNYYWPTHSI